MKFVERHALKIKINVLDSIKLNNSAYKKSEYTSLEKDILFENTTLSRTNSFQNINNENLETNSKNPKNPKKLGNVLLTPIRLIEVIIISAKNGLKLKYS